MVISLFSPTGQFDSKFLANYAYINLNDALLRVPGVGSVSVFGSGQYALRIWVDPNKLAALNITTPEIERAISVQNTVNPAGQVGGEPMPPGQAYTNTVLAQGRLETEEQFGNIVLRATPNGSFVRAHFESGTFSAFVATEKGIRPGPIELFFSTGLTKSSARQLTAM